MEHEAVGGSGSLDPLALQRILPENSAEYMIFVIEDCQGETADSKPVTRLEAVRKAALQLSEKLTKNYIWQREAFNLKLVSQKGLLYLHGITDYGDCVEDEWLIVYILHEISKLFSGVWVRICDSDGEFLLVEAANTVPKWINPEMDAHRIWIHNGQLKLIRPASKQAMDASIPLQKSPSISLVDAVQVIKSSPESLCHIPDLEAEAFYRLGKYPEQIKASIHYSQVLIPRKIAFILHDRPQAIAPAAEAFYMRDPAAMTQIASSLEQESLLFPPVDLVPVGVQFTRVLFAQLRGLRFTPPEAWSKEFASYTKEAAGKGVDSDARKARVMANLGMKITCGFELMARTAETNNSRVVREVGLVLEDLAEDGDGTGLLPTNDQIQSWENVDRDDDESWLDINFGDFERELDSGQRGGTGEPASTAGFGDPQAQTDLRKIVSRFQSFLDDSGAGVEGVDMDEMDNDDDDDDDDDSDVSFDEATFSRLMREMMGLPPDVEGSSNTETLETSPTAAMKASDMAPKNSGGITTAAQRDLGVGADDSDDADDDEILDLAAQFEAELKGHGALRINPPEQGKQSAITQESDVADKAASAAESDDDGEVDIDYNLARNLLESFKSQAGMAGPAGNILGMMGLSLPRDDDQEDDEEENKIEKTNE